MSLKIKLLLAIVLLFTALNIDARNEKISWKIQAGLNLSQISASEFDDIDNEYLNSFYSIRKDIVKPGFNIGFRFDYRLNNYFAFQTGLEYTTRGEKIKINDEINCYDEYGNIIEIAPLEVSIKNTIHYFELPILIGIRYNINHNIELQFNTGPYIAVGLGGKRDMASGSGENNKSKSKQSFDPVPETQTQVQIFGELDRYKPSSLGCKRFDAGWKFDLGVDIKKYYVGIAYDLGLVDIRSEKTKEFWSLGAMKNRNFSINVGYSF